MNHTTRMLIACVLPLALLFLLPLLGLGQGTTLLAFLALFLAAHLLMMRGHDPSHGPGAGRGEGTVSPRREGVPHD